MLDKRTKQSYLDAIGIQTWQLRANDSQDDMVGADEQEVLLHRLALQEPEFQELEQYESEVQDTKSQNIQNKNAPVQNTDTTKKTNVSEPANVFEKKADPIVQTGYNRLSSQADPIIEKEVAAKKSSDEPLHIVSKPATSVSDLKQSIQDCQLCSNRQTRLNALAGQGSESASVFIISEAPTAEEDRYGQYLNDQTAQLFVSMLETINIVTDYFYTGIIKCYSFSEYLVNEEEVLKCQKYLFTQIQQVQPSVLVALGAAQGQSLLQTKISFNELRGKVHHITINEKDYPLIVSYHPSYLLRNSQYKRNVMNDLLLIKSLTNG